MVLAKDVFFWSRRIPPKIRLQIRAASLKNLYPGSVRKTSVLTPPPACLPFFTQRVELADGTVLAIRSSGPGAVSILTRDSTNHTLWNPDMDNVRVDDLSGKLAKFTEKYSKPESGGLGEFSDSDLQWMEQFVDKSQENIKVPSKSTAPKKKTKRK